ncbi:MAG TPA: thioredoxin domain-containing protein [Gemmatimonadaceae bacterium]|nr:thioredoxin domain-containing protein [Gemmatimonadaceae bacterium]
MTGGRLTPPVGADDHVQGPEDAPVTLVEYGDFECPSCGMAYPILKVVQEHMGARLRFVFRPFPLTESHPHAQHAAEAAEAAAAQGYFWAMHDMLFEHQRRLEDEDLVGYAEALGLDAGRVARELAEGTYEARVRSSFRGGIRSGVNGTPTFFINGERYDGPWTEAGVFVQVLSEVADATGSAARR